MKYMQKTCNLCILTLVAFGVNVLSNYHDAPYTIFVSILLSAMVVIGSLYSRDKGKYIRWFLITVNGLYVFLFGVILWLTRYT